MNGDILEILGRIPIQDDLETHIRLVMLADDDEPIIDIRHYIVSLGRYADCGIWFPYEKGAIQEMVLEFAGIYTKLVK